jgi:uncharacterized protein involved in exopolysaccharide biosynthesis/MinD-like ATPase involved in chromosome partitioning or flagellar assembly
MTTGLIAVGLGATVGLVVPPRYTAKAQVIIDPPRGSSAGGQPSTAGVLDDAAVQTQVAALISHSQLQRVLDSIVAEQGPGATEIQARRGWGDGELDFETLKRHINVFKEDHSRVIGVTYTSTDPTLAAAVANRTVELYLAALMDRTRVDRNETLISLNERLYLVRVEVARADAALQNYRIKHGFTDANRTDIIDQQLVDLNRQLAIVRSDLAERHARLTTLRELLHREDGTALLVDALNDPALRQLYREEVVLRSRPDDTTLLSKRGPNQKSASTHSQELRARIGQNINEALNQLAEETGILETRARYLQKRIAILQDASTEAREPEVRLRELQREATASTLLYESLSQRHKALLEEGEVQPDVRVLSFASIPDRPSSPNPILYILPAMALASIGAGLLAVLLEQLDDGLRTEGDVNGVLGIPCIGLIPRLTRLGQPRSHQILLQDARYIEAIRSVVAAALQLTNPQTPPKVFLVTSSVPGEGKTVLAISFAVYAARLQRRVLLIDLAFRHPAISNELGATGHSGILDVLQGRPLAEKIKAAPDLGFDYLPLSRTTVDPVAILAGEQVPDLLRQLKESYDCVVIDSSPLLSATEVRLLASMSDEVLFAVKWGSTRRKVAQNALKLLQHFAFREDDLRKVTSVVITQVNLKRHARYRYGDSCESLMHLKSKAA